MSRSRTPIITTTFSTSARRWWKPGPRFTRSSRRPDGGRGKDPGGGRQPGHASAGAVIQAPLSSLADGTVAAVLRGLLPGADDYPGDVLPGGPARIRQPQVRIRLFPVQPGAEPAVHHDLRTHAG